MSGAKFAARDAFEARFGRSPELWTRAPGRVNLIGEHTDYSEGLALPCAIDRALWMAAAARDDGRIRASSADQPELVELAAGETAGPGSWARYLLGVVAAARERGLPTTGLDIAVAGDLPLESGLSSSAALCVAFSRALAGVQGLDWSPTRHAELAHRAESHFVGSGCGILDPFAIALGQRGHATRIDCRTRDVSAIPLPADRVHILIAHSGVRRRVASRGDGAGYGDRLGECAEAFAAARRGGVARPEARSLRDLAPEDLPRLEAVLEPLLLRRARHVILENRRVERFCDELARADLPAAGELLREGQRSLRDDFEVSIPELDHLCAVADALPGVWGSRLTGAGFGGCTVHLIAPGAVTEVADELARAFAERFGAPPLLIETGAAQGASTESP